jgi:uncharacterized membrane protein YeaQ/YmgE (transglycosylase-associated protein family)
MYSKKLILLGMTAGSLIGGYVPALFGDSGFSFTSLITGGIGAVIGIYLAYRLTR